MVKTPNVRHSKPRREPVTIDLTPEAEAAPKPEEPPKAAEAASFGRDAGKPTEAAKAGEAGPQTPPKPPQTPPKAEEKPAAGSGPAGKPASEEPKSRGFLSAVAAGLIGAVIALGGGGALQYAGLLPAPGAGAPDTSAIEAEIASLKGEIDALPRPVDPGARIDALTARIEETQAQIASAIPGDAIAALDDRLKAAEATLSELRTAPAASVDLGPVSERIATVEGAASEAAEAAREAVSAVGAVTGRIDTLEKSVSDLTGKVAEQAGQPSAALVIAASALKSAIERGGTFTPEADTYAALAPASPDIDALRDLAAAGVPSRSAITAAMPDAANAMVAAAQPQDPNAGLLDRLVSSAQSLVQVRPVGMIAGEGAPETVARMEAHVTAGDYTAALGEYDKLPDAPKAAGAAFAAMLKSRLDADALVERILAGAIKS